MVLRPGPHFSVADVSRGWVKGLRENGCTVADVNVDDRLNFYNFAHVRRDDGEWQRCVDEAGMFDLTAKSIAADAFEFWPHLVLVVSGFFTPPRLLELLRARGMTVVLLHTESPYEDEVQLKRARFADVNLLNDPTNLAAFEEIGPAWYVPHAYDPELHHPREPKADLASDFCFVGTGYESRIAFLEAVDWEGLDPVLAGNWQQLSEDSPLREFVVHPLEHCCDNADAVDLYASTKASANLYRREANASDSAVGWAMGPREVELAACGTFFLRDPRPESDEVLHMLPTFDGPEDFTEKLRWWLTHDDARQQVADKAREAVVDRTFAHNAAELLRRVAV